MQISIEPTVVGKGQFSFKRSRLLPAALILLFVIACSKKQAPKEDLVLLPSGVSMVLLKDGSRSPLDENLAKYASSKVEFTFPQIWVPMLELAPEASAGFESSDSPPLGQIVIQHAKVAPKKSASEAFESFLRAALDTGVPGDRIQPTASQNVENQGISKFTRKYIVGTVALYVLAYGHDSLVHILVITTPLRNGLSDNEVRSIDRSFRLVGAPSVDGLGLPVPRSVARGPVLEFCGSQWTDIPVLISCNENSVTDLAPLQNMAGLAKLDLMDTGVRDLGSLAELATLTHINLAGTQVVDLEPLGKLSNLEWLRLSPEQVSKSQLEQLRATLPSLTIQLD